MMDGLGVDEGDGEALRCQLDGKVNCWDDMALKRKGYEDDMGFLVCLCHISMRVLLQGGRGREGEGFVTRRESWRFMERLYVWRNLLAIITGREINIKKTKK